MSVLTFENCVKISWFVLRCYRYKVLKPRSGNISFFLLELCHFIEINVAMKKTCCVKVWLEWYTISYENLCVSVFGIII
jgi:hypothetical protein